MHRLPISIIVPTLNASDSIPATLSAIAEWAEEIIVVDGQSNDVDRLTATLADHDHARCVVAPRGRGSQLAFGADLASQPWLMFLHADTVLEKTWAENVQAFVAQPGNHARAAAFTFALDMPGFAARQLERYVAWRSKVLGLPYGDQGLLISHTLYDQLGGFKAIPLMEDVDLIRRIGKARLSTLSARAVTSAARYRRSGILVRGARNLACLVLYFCGVPPRHIARLYG